MLGRLGRVMGKFEIIGGDSRRFWDTREGFRKNGQKFYLFSCRSDSTITNVHLSVSQQNP